MNWRPTSAGWCYQVSDTGLVRVAPYARGSSRGKILKQSPNDGGYMRVRLREVDGRVRWHLVHVLVLNAFVGSRPSIRHHGAHAPDRNKKNNHVENLRWALREENEADKKPHGTARGGGRVWRPNRERVARIRERVAAGESYTQIAKSEGLHRHSVSRIARGIRRSAA